jgi:uncharacterized membrane protein YhaH (DUF805 family)
MTWRHFLFSFDGRIDRSSLWLRFVLPYFLLVVAITALSPLPSMEIADDIKTAARTGAVENLWYLLSPWSWMVFAFFVVTVWPLIAIVVKRCHDRNHSGSYLLIALIPLIGLPWLLFDLGFRRGTVGANKFGSDPRRDR